MPLGSIDSEISAKICKQKNANNSSYIDPRDIKIPPFDASHHGDSNELCYKFLLSVDDEQP